MHRSTTKSVQPRESRFVVVTRRSLCEQLARGVGCTEVFTAREKQAEHFGIAPIANTGPDDGVTEAPAAMRVLSP